jgi:predicted O-methyltransferase YrrM
MTQEINQKFPIAYKAIDEETKLSGFTMASDVLTCSLLRTLAMSKSKGKFLEMGTGTGLSTAWLLDGMDSDSSLISVDNDSAFLKIAEKYLGKDSRLQLVCKDGGEWLAENKNEKFDFIFADTWHGKYLMLDEAIEMLNVGGFYIIDDMLPQANWYEGHDKKVAKLIDDLEKRNDLIITKQIWATGIIIGVKR